MAGCLVAPKSGQWFAARQQRGEAQLVLIGLVTALSWVVLVCHQPVGILRTAALVPAVAILGVLLVHRVSVRVQDVNVQRISLLFLLKIPFVLLLMYWAWVPELHPMWADNGYDPQRYYYQAFDVAQSGFQGDVLASVNYGGILFYYGAVFMLFGHNPAAPALINCLTTLVAGLALVEAAHLATGGRRSMWMLGFLILLPELVWFDALTSRESIAMTLLITATLPLGSMFLRQRGLATSRSDTVHILQGPILLSLVSLAMLSVIRTTMLLPAAAIIMLLFVTLRMDSRRRLAGFLAVGLTLVVLVVAPSVVSSLRSFDFGYLRTFQLTREATAAENIVWSERSFGQLLVPDTLAEEFLFAPIRLVFYVVTPLPSITFHLTGLVRGGWQDWQNLSATASAVIYLFLLPRCVASLLASIRDPQLRSQLLLHVPLWIALSTIAIGNVIIVARYRVMAAGLLWACGCLPEPRHRRLTMAMNGLWFGALLLGGFAYILYKT